MVDYDLLALLPIEFLDYERTDSTTITVKNATFKADFGDFNKNQSFDRLYVDVHRSRIFTIGGTETFFDVKIVAREECHTGC